MARSDWSALFPSRREHARNRSYFSDLCRSNSFQLFSQKRWKKMMIFWTGKVYWQLECIPTASKIVWSFHAKRSKHNLFGKFVEYYNLVLNKTCNDNRMLWKQRRLISRKCTMKIREVMVNDAQKNYIYIFWQVRRKWLGWKGFGTVARLTIVLNGKLEPFERMTIFSNG